MTGSQGSRGTILIGAVTGLLSGLMGVGGGVIMVPLMATFLPLTQHICHGTSLAVVMITGAVSAVSYAVQGSINWGLALELAAGTVVGVRVGALWMNRIPAGQLRRAFGVLLVLVGVRMVVPLPAGGAIVAVDSVAWYIVVLVIGLGIGILSGLMGVGGGIFLVPAMALLLGVAQQEAQGVSLAVVVPTAIVGAYTHYNKGNIATQIVPWLAIPSMLTALVGSYIAHILPAEVLRQVFGLLLLFVGGQMALTKPRLVPAVAKVGDIADRPDAGEDACSDDLPPR